MASRVFTHHCNAWSTTVNRIPATLLASQQQMSQSVFYVKLKVDFMDLSRVAGHHSNTYVREMFYPTDQVSELIRSVKDETSSFLDNRVGPHFPILRDLNFRLTECTAEIVANPNHTESRVLPIEVHVSCMALSPAEPPATAPPVADAFVNVWMKEAVTCTVCLEDIEPGSMAGRVPCRHFFHQECITNWLTSIRPPSVRTCPNCRYVLG